MQKAQRLMYDPVGWDTLGKRIKRDARWHGVFFEYSPKLKFIKDGRAIIHSLYEQHGPDTEITVIIYKKNKSTRQFDLYYTGKINLMSLSITSLYAECNVEQTGFTQKLKNRQDIKVNLSQTISQEGKPLSFVDAVTKDLPQKVILKRFTRDKAYMCGDECIQGTSFIVNDDQTWYILYSFDSSTLSFDEISERFSYGLQASQIDPVTAQKHTHKVTDAGVHRVSFHCHNRMTIIDPIGGSSSFQLLLTYGRPGNYTTEVVGTASSLAAGVIYQQFENDFTITLEKEDEIYIYYKLVCDDVVGGSGQVIFQEDFIEFTPTPVNLITNISIEADTIFPASQASLHLMHEAFTRVVENITDRTDCFRSTLYGRTDSQPVTYPADGDAALKGFANGKRVRGFPEVDNPNYASLKDLIEVAQAVDGAGIGIEIQNGKERVVVEKLPYFYQNVRVVQFAWVKDIEKLVLPEYYFNELDGGYDKWGNEAIGNLDEPNARREFTLPISQIKKKLSLKSPYPASSYLMEQVRREHYTVSQTKDNKFDSDNFLLQFMRDGGVLVVEYADNFENVANVISEATLANVRLSPMRNIINNGALIRGGLYHRDDQKIKLAFGEGNTKLMSKLPGDDYSTFSGNVLETEVSVNKLARPLWIPEGYKFKATVDQHVMSLIEANRYGYIEFAQDDRAWKKGYLLDLEPDPKSEMSTFTVLRANL